MKKIIGVIPARYSSSRFPGKPLSDIYGKPMIWWVYKQAEQVSRFDRLVVATDDDRIADTCSLYNIDHVITSNQHPTGSDRVAEVSKKIQGDIYIVIFGDEPMISPLDIDLMIDSMLENPNDDASMLVTPYKNAVDVVNNTTVKVAMNNDNEIIFMSRCPIPYPKGRLDYTHYKHVGVYGYTNEALDVFRSNKKDKLEEIEDVETLRLLEKHKIVRGVLTSTDAMSVDTEKDLERIKSEISKNLKMGMYPFYEN